MANTAEKIKVDPLKPTADVFGLIEHAVRRFNAVVPGNYADNLEDPHLWVHVAPKMEMGCEVRCVADDYSFLAYGICTFHQGSTVKIKIYEFHELDAVDQEEMADEAADFEVKLRGPRKWSIVKKSDGSIVKEDMATQLEAMRELDEYKKALRA